MSAAPETRVAVYRPPTRRLPLFVYGKLANGEFAAHLLGREVAFASVALLGFRSVALDREGFPLLLAAEGSELPGKALLDLTPPEFERLDAYGGVGEGLYERREAAGRAANGEMLTLYVYLASEKTRRRFL